MVDSMGTTKKQILDEISALPEPVDLDQVISLLYRLKSIQRGLALAAASRSAREARDREILAQSADRLNEELADALEYQDELAGGRF